MPIQAIWGRFVLILGLRRRARKPRFPAFRGVAQPGSASALGAGGRWFKSSLPDQTFQWFKYSLPPSFTGFPVILPLAGHFLFMGRWVRSFRRPGSGNRSVPGAKSPDNLAVDHTDGGADDDVLIHVDGVPELRPSIRAVLDPRALSGQLESI